MEDIEPRDADEGDELESAIVHADHAFGSESEGTTAEETLEGESLDERLAEELPETPEVESGVSLVDEGVADDEEELLGEAVEQSDPLISPEEAALSVRDGVPGATDHEDPHPDEEE